MDLSGTPPSALAPPASPPPGAGRSKAHLRRTAPRLWGGRREGASRPGREEGWGGAAGGGSWGGAHGGRREARRAAAVGACVGRRMRGAASASGCEERAAGTRGSASRRPLVAGWTGTIFSDDVATLSFLLLVRKSYCKITAAYSINALVDRRWEEASRCNLVMVGHIVDGMNWPPVKHVHHVRRVICI